MNKTNHKMSKPAKEILNPVKNLWFSLAALLPVKKFKKYQWYKRDLATLKQQKGGDKTFEFGRMFPILSERNDEGGIMKGHYFHQDLYVARLVHAAKPVLHLDIGSRTDGFVAHVASFRQIELVDIRPIKSSVKNISFKCADLMQLPAELVDYCDSVSSLHVIEHFGLGRYGDPIDYFGHLKAIQNIAKIIKPGGTFYFSTPIGPQRIEFNAHRVFDVKYLLTILSDHFSISTFSYVNDAGDFFEDVPLTDEDIHRNYGCVYGCGIFVCIKK